MYAAALILTLGYALLWLVFREVMRPTPAAFLIVTLLIMVASVLTLLGIFRRRDTPTVVQLLENGLSAEYFASSRTVISPTIESFEVGRDPIGVGILLHLLDGKLVGLVDIEEEIAEAV